MSPQTKNAIIKALKADLSNAGDNLYRATTAFKHDTMEDMGREYGQSGQTRQQILDGYQKWHKEAREALQEAEASL